MTKVKHIKCARQCHYGKNVVDVDIIYKGFDYYTWQNYNGQIFKSRHYPKPSDLTESKYLRKYYKMQELTSSLKFRKLTDLKRIQDIICEIVVILRSLIPEQILKLENMPKHLRKLKNGPAGQINRRVDAYEDWADYLDNIEWDWKQHSKTVEEAIENIQEYIATYQHKI